MWEGCQLCRLQLVLLSPFLCLAGWLAGWLALVANRAGNQLTFGYPQLPWHTAGALDQSRIQLSEPEVVDLATGLLDTWASGHLAPVHYPWERGIHSLRWRSRSAVRGTYSPTSPQAMATHPQDPRGLTLVATRNGALPFASECARDYFCSAPHGSILGVQGSRQSRVIEIAIAGGIVIAGCTRLTWIAIVF